MKIEIPTLILAVIISTVIMVAFPDWARRQVQRFTPWGGDAVEEVQQPKQGENVP